MADAVHPQTLLTYAMNDGDLPVGFGGPLRLRVPRQLGYKSVKFITRLTVTDSHGLSASMTLAVKVPAVHKTKHPER